jgi:UDP-galactopyranose mutase
MSKKNKRFAIVGAGFTGAILANELSGCVESIDVFEARNHIGGNCFTYRDFETNILIHKYGPHIFHTDNEIVWNYVTRYANFVPFINRVKSTVNGKVYSLPINLHTINQFFNKSMNPEQALRFIDQIADKSIIEPTNFEEQALKFVGKDLYEAFLKGYTLKQWGIEPNLLPASILSRLPLRFNYNDNYFSHKFQGIPEDGYTPIFEKLFDKRNIMVYLEKSFPHDLLQEYDHVFYTGPIDSWFNYSAGRLGYRTLDFVREKHSGDYQGCAVMNYGDLDVDYTRITEHKHFSTNEMHEETVIYKEYSRLADDYDDPYYPIRLINEKKLLSRYIEMAKSQSHVSFLGRLGTYRYIDMDVTISEALDASMRIKNCLIDGKNIPVFFVDPS